MNKYDRCPCSSKELYHKCCQRFHDGALPDTALQLMRSRFCAYALGLSKYIIETTHRNHESYMDDKAKWKESIDSFSANTKFDGLTIVDFTDGKTQATVKFTAHLRQGGQDATFTETSGFVNENGRWLYETGTTDK